VNKPVAWEVGSEEDALLALAGHASPEIYYQDRLQRAEEVKQVCRVQASHRIFEIGSGDGTVAKILSSNCARLDCNDISESFLNKARRNCAGIPNIAFHAIGFDYLQHLPSASYDSGFSLNVFIHFNLYEIFCYLTEVERLLQGGGLFYFDACTLGDQTLALFREQAVSYKEDRSRLPGLLNFNHPEPIARIIQEVGLHEVSGPVAHGGGWLKFLLEK
jgi:SAM-dependent methyltransferase